MERSGERHNADAAPEIAPGPRRRFVRTALAQAAAIAKSVRSRGTLTGFAGGTISAM
jgi:hypothetical protein